MTDADLGTPVLDDHLHLAPDDPDARGLDAVDDFCRAGGTHLLIVNRPSWQHGVAVESRDDFRAVFDRTCETVAAASARLPGRAWPVLGVHPGLVSRLVDDRGYDPAAAADLMRVGLDVAAEYVADGPAVALKSGRPHYDVADAVADASNAVLRHALSLGATHGCAVQLHTEATTDLTDVAAWARDAGIDPANVVKHYASESLDGVTPSVMAREEWVAAHADGAGPFLLETDFLDDPDRPGAVLGPKTVPRRTRRLLDAGADAAVRRAHVETPGAVYGIDTVATLDR